VIGEESVGGFLESVASDAPVPGGGSVAAVAGATGAALIAMAARLTAGHAGFEAVEERMRLIAEDADAARTELLGLADRDADAFAAVMAAFRMPKEADEEAAARTAAIQAAFAGAAAVPLEVGRCAAALMAIARRVVATGNPDCASDGASGAAMLHAAVACAVANVEVDAAALKDEAASRALREEAASLRARAAALLDEILTAFREAVGGA